MKVVALVSGGKDSWYNGMHCAQNGHEIVALANLRPPPELPDEIDSFMYQTVGHDAVHLQAECMNLPLYREYITGQSIDQALNYTATPNDETEDLFRLLEKVKQAHPDVQAVSVGAILSNYQRARVENVCVRLGLTCLAFLWQRDQKELLAEMIANGLVAVVIKVAAIGLKSVHLGKTLNEMQPTLLALVSPRNFKAHARTSGLIYTSAEREANSRLLSSTVLYGPSGLSCINFRERSDLSDSHDIIDHSTGDVAYLRISAHTEERQSTHEFSAPPLLGPEFSEIFTAIKDIPPYKPSVPASQIPQQRDLCPRQFLNPLGEGVFASNKIYPLPSTSIQNDIKSCLDQLLVLLRKQHLKVQHIISITLLLRDMSDFATINPIYASYITTPLPPSRVTISTCIPESMQLYAIISTRPRTGLHVQSRSYWAPANIGPYSQAISYDNKTFLAGQIGLIPAEMELPEGKSAAMQAVLSLQHIFRVARAVNVDPLTGIEGAAAYITTEGDVNIVAETWRRAFSSGRLPPLAIVLVTGLPRGAKVEWHIIRCQRTSEGPEEGKFKMIFDDELAVMMAGYELRDKENDVLCLRFGTGAMNWSSSTLAFHEVPTGAVYAVTKHAISRHKTCVVAYAA